MEWMPYVVTALVPTLAVSGGLGWHIWQRDGAHSRALTARDQAIQRQREQAALLQAQLESSAQEWTHKEQQLYTQLREYQEANSAYVEEEEAYTGELRSLRGQLDRLRRDLEGLTNDRIQMRRHSVLLDGISGAGKSTLIERLTNPGATTAELASVPATPVARRIEPVPLCWELVGERRVLHTLEFYDMGGESPGQVVNNIREFGRRRADEEAAGQAVALVLWDAVAELNPDPTFSNSAQLNGPRLNAIYDHDDALRAISSFVFFLNKIDMLQARLEEDGRGHRYAAFIEEQRHKLRDEVYRKSLSKYPEPELAVGSALDGRGVHDCLGAIMRQLGLAGRPPARRA